MAAANTSPRKQREAVLASTLGELIGFVLAVDCLTAGCRRERAYAVHELAGVHGRGMTVTQAIRRMRCAECGEKPPRAAWLLTGPDLSRRIRPRRVPLIGPDARD